MICTNCGCDWCWSCGRENREGIDHSSCYTVSEPIFTYLTILCCCLPIILCLVPFFGACVVCIATHEGGTKHICHYICCDTFGCCCVMILLILIVWLPYPFWYIGLSIFILVWCLKFAWVKIRN